MDASELESDAAAELMLLEEEPFVRGSVKAYLAQPMRAVPAGVDAYHRFLLSTSPPLVDLCPQDFETDCWDSFLSDMNSWFSGLPDRPLRSKPEVLIDLHFRGFLFSAADTVLQLVKGPKDVCAGMASYTIGNWIGAPELVVSTKGHSPLVVGVMVGVIDTGAVARVYAYMLSSGSSFGVVSSYAETKFCARLDNRFLLSDPVPLPLIGIRFLIHMATGHSLQQSTRPLPSPRGFASRFAMGVFETCCHVAGVHRMAKMVHEVGSLEARDLQILEFLSGVTGRISAVYRALYKGKNVVVKITDLTTGVISVQDCLMKCVREVDTYIRLHKLQRTCIPCLFEYGFLCGGMFFCVVMSDAGYSAGEGWSPVDQDEVEAVVSRARQALERFHARGVAMGDLCVENILVWPHDKRVTIVGFEECLVGPACSKVAMDNDTIALRECELVLQEMALQETRATRSRDTRGTATADWELWLADVVDSAEAGVNLEETEETEETEDTEDTDTEE